MLLLLWGIIFASFLSADNIVLLKNVESSEKISITESSVKTNPPSSLAEDSSTLSPSLAEGDKGGGLKSQKNNSAKSVKIEESRNDKKIAESKTTHPLTPSAREGGQVDSTSARGESKEAPPLAGGVGVGLNPVKSTTKSTQDSTIHTQSAESTPTSSLRGARSEASATKQFAEFASEAKQPSIKNKIDCHDLTLSMQGLQASLAMTKTQNLAKSTKYFKKRNYENPFSSEAQDYKDSILIERDLAKDSADSTDFTNDSADLTSDSIKDSADSTDLTKRKKPKIYKKILESPKPKIVIIIDDIANTKQLDAIKSMGLKLTPSIFPLKDSNAKMRDAVANLDFFMVHLPLEALAYKDEMDTITLDDSKEKIQATIEQIKRTMPNAKYLNNHTGSKFTAHKDKMTLLLSLLDLHNIAFVDSRTTPNTALPAIAQEQNRLILQRDIFIDNALDSASLRAQISEGVKIAKAQGYAILIAHPHKETLNALKVAKNSILKEVEIVYLNELDSALKRAKITKYTTSLFK